MGIIERIRARILPDKNSECWLWTGYINKGGYGNVRYDGKMQLAHRTVFELFHERKIEEGKLILHHCDNRKCVNPQHLYEGTHVDNMRDMYSKNRQPNRAGETNGNSRLKIPDVIRIRESKGSIAATKLAKEYGVTDILIRMIWRNEIWINA